MGLKKFKKRLKREGWMTSPDGEEFCPKCWESWLAQFSPEMRRWAEKDSCPTAVVADTRRCLEGWLVLCEGKGCEARVFEPRKKR